MCRLAVLQKMKNVYQYHCILVIPFLQGRYELKSFTTVCRSCGGCSDPFNHFNLLSSGYCFASPVNVLYLFTNDVFQLWDVFRKNMPGSSETAFLKSLDQVSHEFGRVSYHY